MTRAILSSPVLAFARMSFTDMLAYRVRYIVGVVNYVIYMAVQYFMWTAVYASAPEGTTRIGGFSFEEMVTYFAIGWIVRVSYYNNIDRELADRVNQGDIALDLLRPVSLLERCYGEAIGEALLRVVFMGVPTALILFPVFGVRGPALPGGAEGLAVAAAFVASVLLAFHIFFLINFIVGITTVFFEKIRGLIWAKFLVVQFLSGLLVPFDLFPGWAREVLGLLPLRGIVYGPVMVYVGKARGARLLEELGLQITWTLVLYLFARWLWRRCRRRLLVMGG